MRLLGLDRQAVPAWISDLRGALGGTASGTVIVTTDKGPEYLALCRGEVDAYLQSVHFRYLRAMTCISVLAIFALVVIIVSLLHAWSLYSRVDASAEEVARLNLTLDLIAESVPRSVAFPLATHGEATRADAVVDFLQRKDAVFRAYVEATGNVMKSQIGSTLSELTRAGVDVRLVRSLLATPAGGLPPEAATEDLFGFYVAEEVIGSYDELQRLGNFLAVLPSVRPMNNARATSGFGMRRHPISQRPDLHRGIDYVARDDERIVAAGDGVVAFAADNGAYGNMIVVDHGFDVETVYAHLSRMDVRPGQAVRASDVLGMMGNTGLSTGPHLHFEVRFKGQALDPVKMFRLAETARRVDGVLASR